MTASNEWLQGFAPVVGPRPQLLILGSMPGVASLQATEYYAHPRNRFWPLISGLLDEPTPEKYADRLAMLSRHGIALWDVLGRCQRPGSLDTAINRDTQQPNPIPALLNQHPDIQAIATNGGFASRTFERLFPALPGITHHALPSTSPANARWTLTDLHDAWKPALQAAR